jgi:acyl carrier protein
MVLREIGGQIMAAQGSPITAFLAAVTEAFRSVLQTPDLELAASTSLDDIPGWDSMDMIAFVVELECRYDILFGLPEINGFHTVGDVVRALATKCILEVA